MYGNYWYFMKSKEMYGKKSQDLLMKVHNSSTRMSRCMDYIINDVIPDNGKPTNATADTNNLIGINNTV